MSVETVRYLLKKLKIRPSSEQGQCFLASDADLNSILKTARLSETDCVLEVGAGIGNLAALLAGRSRRVVAVEVDRRFAPALEQLRSVHPNLELIYGDIRKIPFSDIAAVLGLSESEKTYSVVANIPYYLSSWFVRYFIEQKNQPSQMVLLVQKEVAERVVAEPGDHSKLSLSVQMYGSATIAGIVPRAHFYPVPAVDSAILSITGIHRWAYEVPEKLAWRIIAFGFSSKRKKIINNIAAGLQGGKTERLLGF